MLHITPLFCAVAASPSCSQTRAPARVSAQPSARTRARALRRWHQAQRRAACAARRRSTSSSTATWRTPTLARATPSRVAGLSAGAGQTARRRPSKFEGRTDHPSRWLWACLARASTSVRRASQCLKESPLRLRRRCRAACCGLEARAWRRQQHPKSQGGKTARILLRSANGTVSECPS